MRTFLVLTCCLALAGVVRAEVDPADQKGKKKQTTKHVVRSTGNQTGKFKAGKATANADLYTRFGTRPTTSYLKKQQHYTGGIRVAGGDVNSAQSNARIKSNTKSWKVQKFTLQKSSGVPRVQFRINARIAGSDKWQGQNYNAFRIYTSQRHDRDWWKSHHTRIILGGGGYYYWDNGYWCPAWGYDPNYEFYAYDGPIYGYNDLPPDQVIANVQAALQRQGYYHGFVDGMLGPLTRAALANYQRDRGLYITSAIDRPTLHALGMS
jgi:hypothetical protein